MIQKILSLAIVLAALSVGRVNAQQPQAVAVSTGTSVIAASGSLTPGTIISVKKFDTLAIQTSFALSGAGTNNIVATFAKGIDRERFETTPSVTQTIAASGTNTVTGVTALDLGAVPFLKLVSITNGNTPSTVSGLSIKYIVKPGKD